MPTTIETLTQALAHHQAGRLAEAERLYREVLCVDPQQSNAWHLLGVLASQTGRHDAAIEFITRSIQLFGDDAASHFNLAEVYRVTRRFPQAVDWYQRALARNSNDAATHNNLGAVLEELGDHDRATECYRRALQADSNYGPAHINLGNSELEHGRIVQAIAAYKQAVRCGPDRAEGHTKLGHALRLQASFVEAADCYRTAIKIKPDSGEAHMSLGLLLSHQDRMEEAAPYLEKGLCLEPTSRNRVLAALALPHIYQSKQEVLAWRARLTESVRKLHADGDQVDLTNEPAQPPFYLAYQGLNDKDICRGIAGLYTAPQPTLKASDGQGVQNKIRIGFISAHFKTHTIGRLFGGLIAQLDRAAFVVCVLSVGQHDDAMARDIAGHADEYIVLPGRISAARQTIVQQKLDVLVYTDIGMDPVTYALAYSRLAPVQCVTWGHGVTTGIPTLDYFISAEQLECDQSKGQYSEQLVRLKTTALYYRRPALPTPMPTRADFGLPAKGALYACPQSLVKLHPEFDSILADILNQDRGGTLVLIQEKNPRLEELLRQRFATTLGDACDRVLFLRQMEYERFLGFIGLVDVLLDPIHFGGGNTSLEGIALGVPIVTMPSAFLRGRLTAAFYNQMQMTDGIVASPEEYAALAVRLATDRRFRALTSEKIMSRSSVLFENSAGVRELESFLRQAATRICDR